MKTLLMICAATVLLGSMVSTVAAAERSGAVSQSTLNSMGLQGMQPLSDQAGLAVRGKGSYVRVWGSINNVTTYNIARTHFAAGATFVVVTGGGSFGFAR